MARRAEHPTFPILLLAGTLAATVGVVAGCDGDASTASQRGRANGKPTIASLVPAATDVILAFGAGDQLVAVSNYDFEREGTAGKPRVGDYLNTDWEKIRALKPQVMIRQYHPDRVPAGLKEKAESLGIRLVVLQIDGLEDVFRAYDVLGEAAGQPEKAADAKGRLRAQLDAVRKRTSQRPKVSVLVFRDDAGLAVVGPDTFLDELLPYAGATNAAAGLKNRYPTIDREMLRSLDPEVIVQLLPGADATKIERAKQVWADLPHLRAVRNGRVYQLTEWYALLPSSHLGDLAEELARLLHPDTALTQPATRPAPSAAGPS